MNRSEFRRLTGIRLREAKVLLDAGCYEGAYYLAGYAVECALKACIAKQTRRYEFPNKQRANDSYTHNLEELLTVAQLKVAQRTHPSAQFQANWAVVKDWSEQMRYQCVISDRLARDLYSAIVQRTDGVLSWLKRWW